jgi:hypothetical protein
VERFRSRLCREVPPGRRELLAGSTGDRRCPLDGLCAYNAGMMRPRFSIRTLLILVTIVGLYCGCWEMTKRWGLDDAGDRQILVGKPADFQGPFHASPGPFVICRDSYDSSTVRAHREYHVWFFGRTLKLPIQRDVTGEQEGFIFIRR